LAGIGNPYLNTSIKSLYHGGTDSELVKSVMTPRQLSHWPRENIERFSPALQLTLRLESTLLRSLSGLAPDPFWVGNVDAKTFANLVAELFSLSRLKMVASMAKCLLGERSLQFFRFRRPRCVGQRDLYPFAILFRELPVERHEELLRRAMRWPEPLADQVARVLKR